MEGGSLFWIWKPYADYAKYVDQRYGVATDAFCITQSRINLVEVAVGLTALVLSWSKSNYAYLTLIVGATMTWAKTVLYFVLEHDEGYKHTRYGMEHAPVDFILKGVILNGLWIVVPFFITLWACRKVNALLAQKAKRS